MRSALDELRSVLHDAAGAFSLLSTSAELHVDYAERMPSEKLREAISRSTGRLHAALDRAGEVLRKESEEMKSKSVEVRVSLVIDSSMRSPEAHKQLVDVILRVVPDNDSEEGLHIKARSQVMHELLRSKTIYGTLIDGTYAFLMLAPGDTVLFADIQRVEQAEQAEQAEETTST